MSSSNCSKSLRQLLLEQLTRLPDGSTRCNLCPEGSAQTFGKQSDQSVWSSHMAARHEAALAEMKLYAKPSAKRGFKPAAGTAAAVAAALPAVTAASSSSNSISVYDEFSSPVTKKAKVVHSGSSASITSAASSSAVGRLFASQRHKPMIAALTRFLAVNSIAHNVVESPEFADLLLALGNEKVPSRRTLAKERLQQAAQLRDQVRNKIAHCVVTVACDGWTNVQQNKVTNVVIIANGVAFYWCSIVNSEQRNTAEWLAAELQPVIQTLISDYDARVAAFVVDNEAVNGSCFKKLRNELPFLLHIPCAAHTIQLIVATVLEHQTFATTVSQLQQLIAFFATKEHRNELRRVQKGLGMPPLVVVKPVPTRWNSLLNAAIRMNALERAASACFTRVQLPSVTADFWAQLQQLINYLKPFAAATDAVQSDCATLFTVYEQFAAIQQHVLSLGHDWAATEIVGRWQQNINFSAVTAAAMLSFVPLPAALKQKQTKAQQFILDWGTQYLHAYNLFPEGLLRRDIRDILTEQLAEFNGRQGIFAGLDEHKASLQRRAARESESRWQPKLLWLLYPTSELARVAIALLSVSASEAAVERTFSAQAAVHNKLRNRMNDVSVQAEMFIKFNSRMLRFSATATTSAFKRSGGVELLPDDEENEHKSSHSENSDNEHSLLFSARYFAAFKAARAATVASRQRNHASAGNAASSAAAAMDFEDSDSSALTDEDERTRHRQLTAEENEEEAAAAIEAPAAASTAASRRAARRTVSIVFENVQQFVQWFIGEQHLNAESVITGDIRNALQRHSQSKLHTRAAPSTAELVKLVRAALTPPSLGNGFQYPDR